MSCDPTCLKPIAEDVTPRRIQNFIQNSRTVFRALVGKTSVSKTKKEIIESEVSSYIGKVQRDFSNGKM